MNEKQIKDRLQKDINLLNDIFNNSYYIKTSRVIKRSDYNELKNKELEIITIKPGEFDSFIEKFSGTIDKSRDIKHIEVMENGIEGNYQFIPYEGTVIKYRLTYSITYETKSISQLTDQLSKIHIELERTREELDKLVDMYKKTNSDIDYYIKYNGDNK